MIYKLKLYPQARKDLDQFKRHEPGCFRKAAALLLELEKHPYSGTGRPEQLKYDLTGRWSRRINAEHRMVYRVVDDVVEVHVLSMRYHYKK